MNRNLRTECTLLSPSAPDAHGLPTVRSANNSEAPAQLHSGTVEYASKHLGWSDRGTA